MPHSTRPASVPRRAAPEEFFAAMKTGAVIGVVLGALLFTPWRSLAPASDALTLAAGAARKSTAAGVAPRTGTDAAAVQVPALRVADFGAERPMPDARLVADWVVATGDAGRHGFVIVDKKDARVYVFSPQGALVESAPALLGSALGDDSAPGIGEKPLDQVKAHEKTTPAGRFVAEPGRNANGEDVVWVDYDAAVSMHRIRPLVAAERRLERLATRSTADNRISFGCINLPVTFYENVLSALVQKHGAVIYVLPETRTPEQVFGAYDVHSALQQVAHRR